MNPYSSYKPSGIPWLTYIPTHWETKRAKRLFHKMERPPRRNDKVVTCFRDGDVTLRENRRTEGFTESLQEIGYQGIREGDLVVHNMDAFAGAIGVSDSDGKGTPVYSVCTMTPHANAHFYAATIREMARSQWLTALATGIRERSTEFRYVTLAQQILPVPLLEEQAAIVRYIDHADQLISRYIGAKERLIALLEEQRQAVIHQAVTRGLNPDVPLKRSDDDWFIEAPRHWNIQRLKTICTMKSGDGITTESIEPEGPYPVYGGNGIRGYSRNYTHEGHFALIGRQGALCGNVHSASGKFWASEHAVVASLKAAHSLDWFVPLLETMNLNQYSIAAAQPGLSVERVMNLSVPVPPSEEQTKIAEIINQADTRIGSTVSQVQRQIDLMNEYRTRLIADAVTGLIDVHNAPVELPGQHL